MMLPEALLAAFALSWLALRMLHPLAVRVGLLDHPRSPRKNHDIPVPLIGGIAIFVSLLLVDLLVNTRYQHAYCLIGAGLLVVVGALDDRFDLGVHVRFLVQGLAALLMTLGAGVSLETFGNLLGFGELLLGPLAVPITIISIVGIINAFNMIDGIDGLAGGLVLIVIAGLIALSLAAGQAPPPGLLLLAVALLPFLIFNLGLPGSGGRKVFLGDAGSMLLGYLVVWALVALSQAPQNIISPVVALWLVAIPLLDTLTVMARRVIRRMSPFTPDQRHLHHLLLKAGFSARQTLLILLSLAAVLALFGMLFDLLVGVDAVLFYVFVGLSVVYFRLTTYSCRYYRRLKRWVQGRVAPVNKRIMP